MSRFMTAEMYFSASAQSTIVILQSRKNLDENRAINQITIESQIFAHNYYRRIRRFRLVRFRSRKRCLLMGI